MQSPIEERRTGRHKILFVLLVMLVSGPLAAYAAYDVTTDADSVLAGPEVITFLLGESTIVKAPWPTIRVAVTDPTIANVQVLTSEQMLLQGLKVGSTDLIAWNEDQTQVRQWKVRVRFDTENFKARLDKLFPDASLEVDQYDESLIITGLLRSVHQTTQLHQLMSASNAKYIDMTSVAGVQQVQLEVRIAEVSRIALRALGINAFHTDDDWFGGLLTGGSGGALVPSIDIGVPEGTTAGDNLTFQFNQDVTTSPGITLFAGFPRADFQFFLQALIENQSMRLLANPTLVALSGEEASFLAGGEYPIPVVQGSGGGDSITIEYREYGVRVSFRPTVLGDGTIRLHAAPEVSNLSDVGALALGGFSVPALVTRKAETTLELKNGQTFAMAGLLQHDNQAINSSIPGLGALPILGPLFRSVRYQRRETELIVLVTASLVEPMSLASAPPVPGFLHTEPSYWELYIKGRIEGKEPAKIDPDDARFLEQMGLNRLVGPGAWDSYNAPASPRQAGLASNPQAEGMNTPASQTDAKDKDVAP